MDAASCATDDGAGLRHPPPGWSHHLQGQSMSVSVYEYAHVCVHVTSGVSMKQSSELPH